MVCQFVQYNSPRLSRPNYKTKLSCWLLQKTKLNKFNCLFYLEPVPTEHMCLFYLPSHWTYKFPLVQILCALSHFHHISLLTFLFLAHKECEAFVRINIFPLLKLTGTGIEYVKRISFQSILRIFQYFLYGAVPMTTKKSKTLSDHEHRSFIRQTFYYETCHSCFWSSSPPNWILV